MYHTNDTEHDTCKDFAVVALQNFGLSIAICGRKIKLYVTCRVVFYDRCVLALLFCMDESDSLRNNGY